MANIREEEEGPFSQSFGSSLAGLDHPRGGITLVFISDGVSAESRLVCTLTVVYWSG